MNKSAKVLAIISLVLTCFIGIAFVFSTLWFGSGIHEISVYDPNAEGMNGLGVAVALILLAYSGVAHFLIFIPTIIMSSISAAKKNRMGMILTIINVALMVITVLYFIIFFVYGNATGTLS